jgi:hypothetical protein
MRILNGSNLSFVGELALGVIIAWAAAAPQQTSGEQLRGNCSTGCMFDSYLYCAPRVPSAPTTSCMKMAEQCVSGGNGTCYRGSPSGCLWDSNCQAQWHEACLYE